MTNQLALLILVAVIATLVIAACGSNSEDVPSLRSTGDRQLGEPATGTVDADEVDGVRDAEAAMMVLTECLREQGIEVYDPVVDAEGNVGKPEFAEGVDEKEVWAAWEACEHHLEGVSFEKERVDMSAQVDQWVAVATCLRDKGYDVDDPTAETFDQWMDDFKNAIDWDDPAWVADYEECSGDEASGTKEK
jgi:Asp-tRNA(Asn)/Glu-tRNA(Gln) amidotransferase A subunit family amidase